MDSSVSTTPTNTREISERVVKAAESNRRSKKVTSSLAQLRLSNMKLHGRENDMKLLRGKLLELKKKGKEDKNNNSSANNSTDKGTKDEIKSSTLVREDSRRRTSIINIEQIGILPELILISGISGTGKSALVMKGIRDPAQKMGMAFVGGKFDLNNTSLPLSAFVDAMASLTSVIIEGDKVNEIQHDINDTFGDDDALLLIRALPGCEKLFTLQKDETDQHDDKSLVGKEAISRLQYAIRKLLKIICTHLNGLVLFIDDLQWSDTVTLDLLQSISLDSDISNLLIVGAYRKDEVSDTHPLAMQIREKEEMGIIITAIKIGNLTLENVTSLVAEAFGMDDNEDSVKNLSTIVHRKTDGNAFFVLMFLRSLYDEEVLQYNFGTMRWLWDDDDVEAKLATENVATVLVNKLRRLSPRSQSVVKVASCLGAKFSLSAVTAVTENLSDEEIGTLSGAEIEFDAGDDSISVLDISILSELEDEGLWERESKNADVRVFGHDKIQSAAFELIPFDRRDSFRGKIGSLLMEKLDEEVLEGLLFEVVSLRNCSMGNITDEDERTELAKMNLRAGMKASENSAFDSAVVYFKAGRELLGTSGWNTDKETMLILCSEGANACFICGDLITMNKLLAEVLSRDIPVQEKFNAYKVKVVSYHADGEFNKALSTAIEFRKQLGLSTLKNKPVNTIVVIKEFIKTKRALGKRTAEDIANLPDLTDERLVMGQRMLELSCSASFAAQPTLLPLIIFALVKTSLKHGINASSCDAFAGFGFLLCALGKPQEGREMSKAVDLILAKPNMDRMKSRSIFVCEGMIHHWTAPVQNTLGPLLGGYQEGLRMGDVESAVNNLANRVIHLYYSGRPLGGLQKEIKANIDAFTELKEDECKMIPLYILFQVESLLGIKSDMDLDTVKQLATESGNQNVLAGIDTVKLELHVIFQRWNEAINLLDGCGDHRAVLGGLITSPRYTFLEASVSIRASQDKTIPWLKRRKWKKRAIKSIKLIRGWVKKGNVNFVHCLHLLEAELAVVNGKNDKAETSYKSAITAATTNGFIYDRALSHELASVYFDKKGDDYWRDYHLERCQSCYKDWGATAKIEQLTGSS